MIDLMKRIVILNVFIVLKSIKKNNGIERRKLIIESRKENSSASLLYRTFFCVIAANAESKEESRAIGNQNIK